MMNKRFLGRRPGVAAGLAACAVGWLCCGTPTPCHAQPAPVNLSPQLQEIVRLNRAHLGDDVIKAYIKNAGTSYKLSADDILYLNSQGISQGIVSALLVAGPPAVNNPPPVSARASVTAASQATVPTLPPPATASANPPTVAPTTVPYLPASPPPAASDISLAYFQGQLAPYGAWVDIAPYGLCWRPSEAQRIADWRPYFNQGHWQYTDAGWCWQSDYPWGEIAFHYGRWTRDPGLGWVWVPGYNWGPAWVCWRHTEGYLGWAPLPPSARFEVGVGLTFGGRVVTDFDFGLGVEAFAFVPVDHFWAYDFRAFAVPLWRAPGLFRASVVLNGYHFVGGRFVVDGIGRERIAALTHHEIREERFEFRDRHIAHEVEAQRARAVDVQRGFRGGPGFERPGEGRRLEEHRNEGR